jgi:hypothetical protein
MTMQSEQLSTPSIPFGSRVESTDGKRSPPGWKLAATFLAVAVAILGGIAYLNYQLNPLSYSSAAQTEAAAVLASGRNVAVSDANIDWRELRREQIKQMKEAPDVLIFGGSRWQEATSAVAPNKRVYNAFVSNDHFEDMMAITELLYTTHRLPKTLILSVRFSTFEYLDRRDAWWWKSFGPEYRSMAQRLGVPAHSWLDTVQFGKYSHLLAADAILAKIQKYRANPVAWQATDALSNPTMDIVGSDGALRFSDQRLKMQSPAYAEKDALEMAAKHRTTRLKIDETMLVQLEALLKFLKQQGVQVAIVQTPFHPAYYNAIKGTPYYDDVMKIESETKRIAERVGVVVAGGFDAVAQGCGANEYRDFNHSSVNCLGGLVKQVPGFN